LELFSLEKEKAALLPGGFFVLLSSSNAQIWKDETELFCDD
jgi:hypothetical protein